MKKLRILLVLTGMLVALPTFAAPPCSHCNTDIMQCEPDAPATGIVCRDTDCQERHVNCIPAFSRQLAQDLTIASVEVVTPAKHIVTTSAKTVRAAAAKLR